MLGQVFLGWTSTKLGLMCLAQGPQRSDAGEARTRGPSVLSQALYHWATVLLQSKVDTIKPWACLTENSLTFFVYWCLIHPRQQSFSHFGTFSCPVLHKQRKKYLAQGHIYATQSPWAISGLFFWGVQAWWPENSLDNVFFFVLNLFYSIQRGVQWVFLQQKLYFSMDPEGVQHLQGVPLFSRMGGGGPNAYFYRSPCNLWLSGGFGPPPHTPPPCGSSRTSNQLIFSLKIGIFNDVLSHLIWVGTVCKNYQRMTLAVQPGPEVIKLFSSSTQLSTKYILLLNVKMPTIVGVLTFISMINTTSERLKERYFFICRYLKKKKKKRSLYAVCANKIVPDQTAPLGAVWSGTICLSVF